MTYTAPKIFTFETFVDRQISEFLSGNGTAVSSISSVRKRDCAVLYFIGRETALPCPLFLK
ncbi:hypothetical protein QUB68_04165 [Microcoleus sp. A006_D1]|uniref:hypothetical protein n=1 Tax=Microcoleus sp. A006_D1 TaxID=3055267 RepID=UPI002FD770C9